MVAGLFFGIAFGIAGIGAALLGWLADQTSIVFVYHVLRLSPGDRAARRLLPETAKAKVRRPVKAAKPESGKNQHTSTVAALSYAQELASGLFR